MADTSSVVFGLSTILLSPRTVFNQSVLYPNYEKHNEITYSQSKAGSGLSHFMILQNLEMGQAWTGSVRV